MKKLFYPMAMITLFALLTTTTFGCWNIPGDKGPGNNVKEDREIASFSKLQVGGAFKVYLSQGEQEKLVVEADADEINQIVTEVSGNRLKIYTKSNLKGNFHEMNVYLTFKTLDYIDFSGAVEVLGEEMLTFTDLEMDISGASELNLELKAEKLDIEFSGASEVVFKGSCTTGTFETSGASELDASELEFSDLNIEVSGASDARVWATNTLNIDASGASDIRYKGNPKVTIHESGASSVKPLH